MPLHSHGDWKNQSISFHLHNLEEVGLQFLSATKQSASDTILPQRKKTHKNHVLLPSVAEMLEVLIIKRLSSQFNLRPLTLHHYGTLQSCMLHSDILAAEHSHFFCSSAECHHPLKKSSSKSFYCLTNIFCMWKTSYFSGLELGLVKPK